MAPTIDDETGNISRKEPRSKAVEDAMPLIPDSAVFKQKLGALPRATYRAGETVIAAGSRSGKLLILKSGAVAIVKDEIEIAEVNEPGAVLGELSALLDQPHTADVRALETSEFHVADAATLLGERPHRPALRCSDLGATARQRQSCPH